MGLFVVMTVALIIVKLALTSSPDCMEIFEHPSGLPIGSLSSSVQFNAAMLISTQKQFNQSADYHYLYIHDRTCIIFLSSKRGKLTIDLPCSKPSDMLTISNEGLNTGVNSLTGRTLTVSGGHWDPKCIVPEGCVAL